MPMKLLVTTQAVDVNDPILGFFHEWLLEFAKHFERIDVICLRKGAYDLPPHVHVYSLGKEEGESRVKYLIRFYRFFAYVFFRVRVDYVFFHMGAIYNILAAPFFSVRYFFGTTFYWWKAHGRINRIGRFALSFVDTVYTSTESGFPVATSKKRVVGQAINECTFTLPPEGGERNGILYVGRVTGIKRIEDLIATAGLLRDQGHPLPFTIVGPFENEAYEKQLRTQCTSLNLKEWVTFLGPRTQEEIRKEYWKHSLFLNTSQTQSMDKTVLEAMLSGCVPITANVAFADLLSEEGLYVPNAIPEVYAESIVRLSGSRLTELRHRLRTLVVEKHALNTFTKRIFS
jgi:glycosyltransferase involved in cell wall biosynthesis